MQSYFEKVMFLSAQEQCCLLMRDKYSAWEGKEERLFELKRLRRLVKEMEFEIEQEINQIEDSYKSESL